MLLEHDRELLLKTKQNILLLETKQTKFDHDTQVVPFQKKLKEMLERHERDIIAGKK